MTPDQILALCVDEDRDERWRGDPYDYTDQPSRADLAREDVDEITEEDEE